MRVREYQNLCDDPEVTADEIQATTVRIVELFIKPYSANEIMLTRGVVKANIMRKVLRNTTGGVLPKNIFDEAATEIYCRMAGDSFNRFLLLIVEIKPLLNDAIVSFPIFDLKKLATYLFFAVLLSLI